VVEEQKMKKSGVFVRLTLLAILIAACGSGPVTVTPTPVSTVLPPVKASSASGTEGTLEPWQSANLSFAMGGEVAEVLVKEGDTVKANDVIARLRADALQAAVARAEAGVAVARASLAKYQAQLPQHIAAAQAGVGSAQAQIAAASAERSDPAAIAAAQAALAQAVVIQNQAQDAYDHIIETGQLGPTEESARLVLENAKRETQAARLRLDQLKSGSLNDRAHTANLAAANARLQAAQANLDELKAEANGQLNPTYEAAVQQAEAVLQSARLRSSETELRAPFAGTIAQLTLNAGETVGAGSPIAVLADFSSWQVETADLTEVKVPGIKIGQSVTAQLDALPELSLTGEVQSIGQLYQEKSGEVVYPVKINLMETDPRLRWGMTVRVNFAP
jgi:multidrug resistance efflux pump